MMTAPAEHIKLMMGIDVADGPDTAVVSKRPRDNDAITVAEPLVRAHLWGRDVEIEPKTVESRRSFGNGREEVTIKGVVVAESKAMPDDRMMMQSGSDRVWLDNLGNAEPEPHLADLWKG